MKKLVVLLACWLFPMMINAHPGIGIVIDSKGNIFYTDLEKVWKLEPGGKLSVAVPAVHTHELAIDKDDNIYGEHLWYNGERLNTWGHYVWKLDAAGNVEKIKESTAGFLDDYGFLRDKQGNVYWIQRFTISKFMKKTADGRVSEIASGKFNDIRWSYCTPSGIIYFVDLHKLYRLIPDGKFQLLAENLDDHKAGFGFSRKHNVYGLWTDHNENVYIAILSQKKVKRISADGKIEVVAYSKSSWSTTGGAFDRKGNLWLLETDIANRVRVRQIPANELAAKPNFVRTVYGNYLLAAGGLAILSIVAFGIWKLVKISL
jgi:hypothetical protein